jgi:hypothetical protein
MKSAPSGKPSMLQLHFIHDGLCFTGYSIYMLTLKLLNLIATKSMEQAPNPTGSRINNSFFFMKQESTILDTR